MRQAKLRFLEALIILFFLILLVSCLHAVVAYVGDLQGIAQGSGRSVWEVRSMLKEYDGPEMANCVHQLGDRTRWRVDLSLYFQVCESGVDWEFERKWLEENRERGIE